MAEDIREQITEWLTGADTCFLFGAGCSVCAGKPLIGDLTTKVVQGVDQKLKEQFKGLKAQGDRPPTIEDLMTYLVRYKDVLSSITDNTGHNISVEEIDNWLNDIRKKIVSEMEDDWKASDHHQRFFRRVRNPRPERPRDIFSLNYDTVIEASLDELRFPYLDGFRGANRAWFDPDLFENSSGLSSMFRIYKLHGSINWTRDESENVRRSLETHENPEPILVYPSEQKYLQTQYGVYETLMRQFRNRLRMPGMNNCLIILGYSFNDEHINEAICDAVNTKGSNLTVISFVGPDEDQDRQRAKLERLSERCDHRFNAFVGNKDSGSFVGHALDNENAVPILEKELWRFENLVEFIAGETQ